MRVSSKAFTRSRDGDALISAGLYRQRYVREASVAETSGGVQLYIPLRRCQHDSSHYEVISYNRASSEMIRPCSQVEFPYLDRNSISLRPPRGMTRSRTETHNSARTQLIPRAGASSPLNSVPVQDKVR